LCGRELPHRNGLLHDYLVLAAVLFTELRRLIAAHDETADIPNYFRGGGGKITTSFCADGVVVVHMPYDPDSMTFPEREDTYDFWVAAERGRLFLVGDSVHRNYNMKIPDMPTDRKVRAMPQYAPGEDFGNFVRLWPQYESQQAPDGKLLVVTSLWTRLDAASMSSLDVWRDRKAARREAWEALRPYVEGGDVPVPRPMR
jgi:hypothetical protein